MLGLSTDPDKCQADQCAFEIGDLKKFKTWFFLFIRQRNILLQMYMLSNTEMAQFTTQSLLQSKVLRKNHLLNKMHDLKKNVNKTLFCVYGQSFVQYMIIVKLQQLLFLFKC